MKKVTCFLFTLLSMSFTHAQVSFQKVYRDIAGTLSTANAVHELPDGNFIVTGSSYHSSTANDVLLMKTDSNGTIIWSKTFGGSLDDEGSSVYQTVDGGYVICGSTESFGAGDRDYYLIKTDSNGNLMWSKAIGNSGDNWMHSMELTSDGGCIISGMHTPFGADGQLIRTDSLGNVVWAKRYNDFGNERFNMARQTADGGFLAVGDYDGLIGILVKTDLMGTIEWNKAFTDFIPWNVRVLNDNGFLIAGLFSAGNGDKPALIRLDSNRTFMWSKYYDDNGSEPPRSLHVMSDGNFLISGLSFAIKVDENGDTLWTRDYIGLANNGYVCNSDLTADGGFIFARDATVNFVQYAYLIKTDSLGNSGCYEDYSPLLVINQNINIYSLSPDTIPGIITTNVTATANSGSVTDSTLCYTILNIQDGFGTETKKYFSVYPNPVSDFLTIEPEQSGSYNFQLSNIQGKEIYSSATGEPRSHLNLNGFSPGIYFLRMNSGNQIQTERISVIR